VLVYAYNVCHSVDLEELEEGMGSGSCYVVLLNRSDANNSTVAFGVYPATTLNADLGSDTESAPENHLCGYTIGVRRLQSL
jgi:hypothetical protein